MLSSLLLVLCSQAEPAPPQAPGLELLDHAALSAAIDALAAAHPLVSKSLVGSSRGGRAIEALTLRPADTPDDRPAILLVANLSGPEVWSASLALDHARALAEGYGTDPAATALLDACTVIVIPRANPDGAEARFEAPRAERTATGFGIDDDRDGRMGEDPPGDANGDGQVTWMRWRDPEGEWIPDPSDARAMVRADAGEGQRGEWKLAREGRDADGDERVSEDAPLDAEVNRNFAAGWEEHTAAGGLFPTDEPEVRALCDFVLARPNLVLVVTYDTLDSLVEKPGEVKDDAPPVKRVPPAGILASDAKDLARLGERYREVTGNETKGEGELGGSFQRFCYEHRGLLVLAAHPWDLPKGAPKAKGDEAKAEGGGETEKGEAAAGEGSASEAAKDESGTGEKAMPEKEKGDDTSAKKGAKEPKPSADAERLQWIDAQPDEAWRFVPWTPFEHPELGAVEIGGFAPYARSEPPASARAEIAAKHLEWFTGLADTLPVLAIERFAKIRLGEGLWRVELVLVNTGRLPYASRSARRTETVRPARVQLVLPDAAERLAGSAQELVEDLPAVQGRFEASWLVLAPDDAQIGVTIDTDHLGDRNAVAEEAR